MSGVGPMTLDEHLLWLGLLSLLVSLVYNGLRTPSVGRSVLLGVRRWAVFVFGCTALAAVVRVVEFMWLR